MAMVRELDLDADTQSYITAVELADGQSLEYSVKKAFNDFVVGCKTDQIWEAMRCTYLMMGPRTLAGSLVPLKGTTPTNINFVNADYSRKLGLLGGAGKSIESNFNARSNLVANSNHLAVGLGTFVDTNNAFMSRAGGYGVEGTIAIQYSNIAFNQLFYYNSHGTSLGITTVSKVAQMLAVTRNSSNFYRSHHQGNILGQSNSQISQQYPDSSFGIAQANGTRQDFFSVGDFLSYELLKGRYDTLKSDLAISTI